MANIKSAMKRVGITEKQNLRNRMVKSGVKTAIKKFDLACESGDAAAKEAAYTNAVSTVDKAVAKGIMHKNAAAHKKAQFAARLSAAK